MRNHEIAETFGFHRTTLQSWSKSENEGRQLLLYLLKTLPNEYIENTKKSFYNSKKNQELLKNSAKEENPEKVRE
jgi:Cft2 family RNA processing exonuclease